MALDPKLTKFSTASPTIATFPSEEVASGLSQVTFFGIASTAVSTVAYHLIAGGDVYSVPGGTSATTTSVEMNFDTAPFELVRTAKGTAYFSAGVNGSGGGSGTSKVSVQLIHVDSDNNETTITSEITSQTYTHQTANAIEVFLELPITEKLFAKGEKLRMEVQLIKVGTDNQRDIGHDPKNQDFASVQPSTNSTTSVMKLLMSFRREE